MGDEKREVVDRKCQPARRAVSHSALLHHKQLDNRISPLWPAVCAPLPSEVPMIRG